MHSSITLVHTLSISFKIVMRKSYDVGEITRIVHSYSTELIPGLTSHHQGLTLGEREEGREILACSNENNF